MSWLLRLAVQSSALPVLSSTSPTLPPRDNSLFPEFLMTKGGGKKNRQMDLSSFSKFSSCLKFGKVIWIFLILMSSSWLPEPLFSSLIADAASSWLRSLLFSLSTKLDLCLIVRYLSRCGKGTRNLSSCIAFSRGSHDSGWQLWLTWMSRLFGVLTC